MDVSEKKAKLWRKEFQGKHGTFYRYSVSISRKTQEGNYVNAYLPVMFSKKAEAPDDIPNGTVCSIEGFMSVDSYTDKDGNVRNTPQIVVTSVEFDDPAVGVDSFESASDYIPF